MRFELLGPLAVRTSDGTPVVVPGLKVRALLADLLLSRGRTVSADRLVEDLWGEEPPGNPSATLQVRVSQLRKALEDAEPGGRDLIVSRSPGYLIQTGSQTGEVDADRFAALVAQGQDSDDAKLRAKLLGEALELWRGPALADFADEEFARAAVTKLEEQRLTAVESHAEAQLELGLAVELADLVAAHPLRERLRAVHIRALYRAGRQSEALDSYRDLREQLADELGLDPSPELAALHQAILEQDPALSVTRSRPATNLPAPLSDLIGRDEAVAEVHELLAGNRLVTLTGSGGVGKTRLSVETARGLDGAYADGVWLVELAGLDRSWNVADHLSAVLGITGELLDALRARRMLLVLDNCEHLVEQVAELAETLLRAVPGLVVLATSREPLGVPGEVVWNVPPLEVPERGSLVETSAVRLFVARAQAAHRGFTLDEESTAAVALLCRRLDGIPLALELAATRVRALGVQGLVERLDDRFRLLATGHRGAPPRQQTLTAMIGWSWDLLTEPEQVVLRRLAVHADGCTLEAAEAVCDDTGLDVIDLVARLVDRSLVTVVHSQGSARYRLLESVAAYCADRLLEAGELEPVRLRHVRHYTELAERAEPHLYGPEQRRWMRRLDVESANLHAALDHAPAELALRLVNALAWHWHLRGRLEEARRSLAAALAAPGQAPASLRARALAWQVAVAGGAAPPYGEIDDPLRRARAEWSVLYAATDLVDPATLDGLLARFAELGDRWGEAATLLIRAKAAHVRMDLPAIERDTGRSAALFGEVGDRWGVLQANEWQAALAELRADYDGAGRLHREGLAMAEELGLWAHVTGRLCWLSWIAMQRPDPAEALALAQRGLQAAVEQGDRANTVFAELTLGFAARRDGRLDLAERHLRNVLAPEAIHHPMVLTELGFIAALRGDATAALALHKEGLAGGIRIGAPRDIPGALEGLAGALALNGRHTDAAAVLGAAAAFRIASDQPVSPSEQDDFDRITASVRAALGDGYDAAVAEGRELSPSEALTTA